MVFVLLKNVSHVNLIRIGKIRSFAKLKNKLFLRKNEIRIFYENLFSRIDQLAEKLFDAKFAKINSREN